MHLRWIYWKTVVAEIVIINISILLSFSHSTVVVSLLMLSYFVGFENDDEVETLFELCNRSSCVCNTLLGSCWRLAASHCYVVWQSTWRRKWRLSQWNLILYLIFQNCYPWEFRKPTFDWEYCTCLRQGVLAGSAAQWKSSLSNQK